LARERLTVSLSPDVAALLRQVAVFREQPRSRVVEEALDAYLSPHVIQLGRHSDDPEATQTFSALERPTPSWLTWRWIVALAAIVILAEAIVAIILLTR
jgi:hypothetical protein